MYINDFYTDNNADGKYEGFGDGRIETIKAGTKTLKNIPTADKFTDALREQVGSWLVTQKTDSTNISVTSILKDGTPEQINYLVSCFENAGLHA